MVLDDSSSESNNGSRKCRGPYRKYTFEERMVAVSKVTKFKLFRFKMVKMLNKLPNNMEFPGEISSDGKRMVVKGNKVEVDQLMNKWREYYTTKLKIRKWTEKGKLEVQLLYWVSLYLLKHQKGGLWSSVRGLKSLSAMKVQFYKTI